MRKRYKQFSLFAAFAVVTSCAVATVISQRVLYYHSLSAIEDAVNAPHCIDVVSASGGDFCELEFPDIDAVLAVHVDVLGSDDLTDALVELADCEHARVRWRVAYTMGRSCTSETHSDNVRRIVKSLERLQSDGDTFVRVEAARALKNLPRITSPRLRRTAIEVAQ